MKMKQIIVTADDYGMSLGVNSAIEQGIAAGLITSTNVMTNMDYFRTADKLKTLNKNVSVGLHWTLSAGKPVSNPKDIPTLVNEDGTFFPYSVFRKKYRNGAVSNDDIVKELKAQYALFKEVCGEPDYWNTHQNVHVDFKIYQLFVGLAKELGITKMRSHQRLYVQGSGGFGKRSLKWRIMEPFKSRLLNSWQNNSRKIGILSPGGIIVCLNKSDINKLEYVFSHIEWQNETVGEYVIHPTTENDSPYFGKIVEQRMDDYHHFTSQETLDLFKTLQIELVGYDSVID